MDEEKSDIDYAIGCAYNYLWEFGEDTKENLKKLDRASENYISKDKIREKIKELENKLNNFCEEVGKGFYYNNEWVNSMKMAINTLYELLEE